MKRDSSNNDQQQIHALWPVRVKRTRSQARTGGSDLSGAPPAKRAKTAIDTADPIPSATTTTPSKKTKSSPSPSTKTVQPALFAAPAAESSSPSSTAATAAAVTEPSSTTKPEIQQQQQQQQQQEQQEQQPQKTPTRTEPKQQHATTTKPPRAPTSTPASSSKTPAKTSQEMKKSLLDNAKEKSTDKTDLTKKKDDVTSSSILPVKRRKPSSDSVSQLSLLSSSSSSRSLPPKSRTTTRTRLPIPLPPISSSGPAKRPKVSNYQPSNKAKIPTIPSLPSNHVHHNHHPPPSASKPPLIPKPPQQSPSTTISPSAVPGGDALLHDRSKLPDSFALMLDVMNSMEVALGLLRTRRTPATVAAVREIVQRDIRRDFTLRTLAQLAAVVPECVAVSMPIRKANSTALQSKTKLADSLIIRLDDPEGDSGRNLIGEERSELGTGSKLMRRAFLHRRLLEIVREHHESFVRNRKMGQDDGDDRQRVGGKGGVEDLEDGGSGGREKDGGDGDGGVDDDGSANQYSRTAVWHPEFDPNRDVPSLPAPPLFSSSSATTTSRAIASSSSTPSGLSRTPGSSNASSRIVSTPNTPVSATGSSQSVDELLSRCEKKNSAIVKAKLEVDHGRPSTTTNSGNDDDDDDDDDAGIPKSLLARVRSREKTKEHRAERAEEERASNRNIITKLPITMDSINTVLRTEKRSAMGWAQLLNKVAKFHPRKWPKDEVEEQMNAIAKIATEWCTKVELKSSRGGFAFKVVSERAFAQARAKVCSTQTI